MTTLYLCISFIFIFNVSCQQNNIQKLTEASVSETSTKVVSKYDTGKDTFESPSEKKIAQTPNDDSSVEKDNPNIVTNNNNDQSAETQSGSMSEIGIKNNFTNENSQRALIAKAYLRVNTPGAQQVDENGNPINSFIINRSIYVEMPVGKIFKALDAIYGGLQHYNVSTRKIPGNSITLGKLKKDNSIVKLTARKGYVLWEVICSAKSIDNQVNPYRSVVLKYSTGAASKILNIAGEYELQQELLY